MTASTSHLKDLEDGASRAPLSGIHARLVLEVVEAPLQAHFHPTTTTNQRAGPGVHGRVEEEVELHVAWGKRFLEPRSPAAQKCRGVQPKLTVLEEIAAGAQGDLGESPRSGVHREDNLPHKEQPGRGFEVG